MSFNKILKLEKRTKDEAVELKRNWSTGSFDFFLFRTQEKSLLKATIKRRLAIENQLNLSLPNLTDEQLKSLYIHACLKYKNKCRSKYGESSGFLKTYSERIFLETLQRIIHLHPKLKHLEIYPSLTFSKDLPTGFKMVIGNYVPDFIIFGIKDEEYICMTVEIDGDSHINKFEKDDLRRGHLNELNILQWEVPNDQVKDYNFITATLLKMHRLRTGSFNSQVKRAKRKIWVKTILCQLSLDEIEQYCKNTFNLELNLIAEARALAKHRLCPKKIKAELVKL